MHLKIMKKKAIDSIIRLKQSLGRRWHHFVRLLELNAVDNAVAIAYLCGVLKSKFDTSISEVDLKRLK